jgi:tetratricopeptide (TPR) repeat protein
LQKQPRDVDLLTALGTMHSEQNPEDATSDGYLAQALAIKPDHLPALYQVGRRLMRAQRYAEAEKTFIRVLALQPGYAKGHAQLGMALYYQERFEPARQAFISALQAAPRDYNTWFNLGEVYLQQAAEITGGKMGPREIGAAEAMRQRAFSSFTQTIELYPDHAMAHYRLGVLLIGNNQAKEAIRHLEYAVKLQDGLVGAWLQLALAYEGLQLFQKARLCLDKAYSLDPLNKVVALKLREWG